MTPTEQDKELREKIADVFDELCEPTNEFWHRDSGLHWAGKVMQLIAADRKRVALEARIDEISHIFRIVDGRIFWQSDVSLAMPLEDRIAELKSQLTKSKEEK